MTPRRTMLVTCALAAIVLGVGAAVGIATATIRRAAAAGARVAIGVKTNRSLGRILDAGPRHLTIYAFARDHRDRSSCTGACARGWPPVTTAGRPRAVAGAVARQLGTIIRSDGRRQATYDGHPVYFFVGDRSAATAAGQRISAYGGRWYAIGVSGREITAAPTTTGTTTGTTPSTTSTTPTSTYTYPSTTSTTPTSTYTYPGY